jgi:hypothetical protein
LFKNDIITNANADVAGMSYYDLVYDWDFQKAVRRVVEKYCDVSGSYLNC